MTLKIPYFANGISWHMMSSSLKYSNKQYQKLKKSSKNIYKISLLNYSLIWPAFSIHQWRQACLTNDNKFDDPTVVYSLINRIRSKTFDFNKFICDHDVKAFLQDDFILAWNCEGSGFIDKDHQLIGTSDFLIIKNNKLSYNKKIYSM